MRCTRFPGLHVPCILALVAWACGGSWSDEDVAFVRALPSRADLSLPAPGAEGAISSPLLGRSSTHDDVLRTTKDVNAFVAALTGGLDFVRLLPPSERTQNGRTWGPYPDQQHPGLDVKIVITRDAPATYSYELQQRRGAEAFLPTIRGHFVGESASRGTGDLSYDGDRGRTLGTESNANLKTLALSWDRTTGDARATMDTSVLDGGTAQVKYVVRSSGGELSYTVHANIENTPTAAREDVLVQARWTATGAGRAHSTISGGDLGAAVGRAVECWDADANQVFVERNFECPELAATCSEGQEAQCAFDGPVP